MPTAVPAEEWSQTRLPLALRGGEVSLRRALVSHVVGASSLSPPPRLEPTAIALSEVKQCGESIAKSAPDISFKLLDAQEQLTLGLLKGGYANDVVGRQGYNRGGHYSRSGEWLTVPPPKDYVEALSHEARWCVQVANVLNTQPEKKEAAKRVLASIAHDLHIKVVDCRAWGAGRLITVIANTVKNGQPDAGWTVLYKWVSVSGLSASDLSFPQITTPTSKALPPGVYSVYATKHVGDTLRKTEPITVSAFQDAKVKMRDPGTVGLRAERSQTEPHEPERFAAFAQFFKAYMGTASVVTASLPIPLAAFHLVPTYAMQEKFLSTYASLFCFLMLGYLFYIRHALGRLMFYTKPDGHVALRMFVSFVPLLLILASLTLVFLYHHYLLDSLTAFSERGVMDLTNDGCVEVSRLP